MATPIVNLVSEGIQKAVEEILSDYFSSLREKLSAKGVDDDVIDIVIECIGSGEKSMKRHLAPNKNKAEDSSSKNDDEDLRVKHSGGDVIVCLNYGPKSHAIFGDFNKAYVSFKDSFLKGQKFIKPGPSLAFGFGWVVMDKTKLPLVISALKKAKIPYREIEREEYAEEIRESKSGGDVKGKTKKQTKEIEPESDDESSESENEKPVVQKKPSKAKPVSKKKDSDSESEDEEPPAQKKPSKAKSVPKEDVKSSKAKSDSKEGPVKKQTIGKNAWGNNEETESGLVFVKLPIGKGGASIPVAVGWQDCDAEKGNMGLNSVLPLNNDIRREHEAKKWKFLTKDMITTVRKTNPKLAKQLQDVMDRGDEESEDE